jgi:aryl-alcohol dehydrogenase-like predicted oxidoreductase
MSRVVSQQRLSWSEIPLSRVGLGLSRIGSVQSPLTADQAERLIQVAFDKGINFFDTADVYGQGDSERLLGSAFKTRRSQVVICTKAGYMLSAEARIASYVKPVLQPILRLARKSPDAGTNARSQPSGPAMAQDFSSVHILRSIEASLRRLRTEYIDLFMLHNPPVHGLDLDELAEALQLTKQVGKIRAFGVSSRSLDDLAIWSRLLGVDAIQVKFDFGRSIMTSLIHDTRARGVSIIAREVLSGSGIKLDDRTAIKDTLQSALRIADIVLIGTTNVTHLRDNVAAVADA